MRAVLKLPAFRRLLAVSMINELALSVGAVALAVLVYRRTGSAIGATGFFLCAEFGPALISPFVVSRLDQRSPRRVLTVLYATQAVIFLVLAWLVGRFAVAPVLALVLLSGSVAGTATVLVRAAWTSVTSASGLVREANALVNSGFSICFMVGPAIGGGLVALGGTVAALLVIVSIYSISSLVMATAAGLPVPGTDRDRSAGRVWAAMRYARLEPMIRRLLGLQAVGLIFFAISIPVEVVFAQHTLRAGPGGYGALLAAWGGGAILGSGLYARWRRLPSRTLIALGTCALAMGFLVMAIAPTIAVAVIGAVLAGVGNGVQIVSVRTALQEAVATQWMALILSLNQSMFQALPGLGIIIGGALMTLASTRVALAVGAGGSFAMALVMWLRLSILGPLANVESEVAGRTDRDEPLPVGMPDR